MCKARWNIYRIVVCTYVTATVDRVLFIAERLCMHPPRLGVPIFFISCSVSEA